MESSIYEWFSDMKNAYQLACQAMSLFINHLQTWADEIFLGYQDLAKDTGDHLGCLIASALNTGLDFLLQTHFEIFIRQIQPVKMDSEWAIGITTNRFEGSSDILFRFHRCIVTLFANFTYLRTIVESF
jgi:hypothetical protein